MSLYHANVTVNKGHVALSNLRNGHVALSILGVWSHYSYTLQFWR